MAIATAEAPGLRFEWADLLGKPFKLGARGPDAFDCYGLVMELGRRAGVELPDHASPELIAQVPEQIETCKRIWTPCKEGPGAVVTFRTGRFVGHVGMVLPFGRFLHSWKTCGGVVREELDAWRHRIEGFYRHD